VTFMQFDFYRPELHYMRGRGPKWHARHDLESDMLGRRMSGLVLAGSHSGMPPPSTMNVAAVRDDEANRGAGLPVKRPGNSMLQTFRNWPNATFAVVCAAGVLFVVFPLGVASSLIAAPPPSANVEPPAQGCVAVSKGEYLGANRKNLLHTRFGAYVTTGRLGRHSYWYCR